MSKREYKVGQRFEVGCDDRKGNIVEITKVDSDGCHYKTVVAKAKSDRLSNFAFGSIFDKTLKKIDNETIVIYRKGQEVIALDKVTGNKAVAKCGPDDEFDFNTGAKLAFERLLGVEQPKEEKKEGCFKVLCIKDHKIWDRLSFAKGKVYEFINGDCERDDGGVSRGYASFEELLSKNRSYKDVFIELKDGDDTQKIMKKYDAIKVGDTVKVIDTGGQFSTFVDFVKKHVPKDAYRYAYGVHLSDFDFSELRFDVLYIDSEMAYIQARNWTLGDRPCFLIRVNCIEKA